MSGNKRDITGARMGRLTVLRELPPRYVSGVSRRFWICQCDCGETVEVMGLRLLSRNTKSCGCLKMDQLSSHGGSRRPEYRVWWSMKQRCENPNNRRFQDYGGRGISVCDEWQDFARFYRDMGPRPSSDHSIDRIDNDGPYSPENCRWATRSQQQNNKRPYPRDHNIPRGDDHWTRKNRGLARVVGASNIRATHASGEANNNAKITAADAAAMRDRYQQQPTIPMRQLGAEFGVGRETARKIIRGLSW